MSTNTRPKISPEELKSLLHPSEDSRFYLALAIVIPLGLAMLWLSVTLVFIIVYIVFIIGIVWLTLQVAKAHLMANAVKVSDKNFPEINNVLNEVLYTLDYDKAVDVYIVEEGTVNAFLYKFFETKFIVLNSELVEDMLAHDSLLQAKWVIARFVGGLKAKHYRLTLLRILIDSIEKIKIFNLFLLPYERAVNYSGDQIGLAVCGDLNQSMTAFQKFMVGNVLSKRVNFHGIQEQREEKNFFTVMARLSSSHPHVIDRFYNLLSFAKNKYPEMYSGYMRSKSR